MCRNTSLEPKGPGSMTLSDVAPFYDGVLAPLNGGKLARVVLQLLGLERGFFSLVHLERRLVRQMDGLLGWVSGVLGSVLSSA